MTDILTNDGALGDADSELLASRDAAKVMIKVWSMSPNANDKPHLIPMN